MNSFIQLTRNKKKKTLISGPQFGSPLDLQLGQLLRDKLINVSFSWGRGGLENNPASVCCRPLLLEQEEGTGS